LIEEKGIAESKIESLKEEKKKADIRIESLKEENKIAEKRIESLLQEKAELEQKFQSNKTHKPKRNIDFSKLRELIDASKVAINGIDETEKEVEKEALSDGEPSTSQQSNVPGKTKKD